MTTEAPARPTLAPHPRLRARRIEVERAVGRRRLRRLAAFAALLGVVAAFAAAVQSPLLDVDHIEVRGLDRLPEAQVREVAGVRRGDAMFEVDPGAAASRLRALPWVKRVDVVRHWPGGVTIELVERRPVALAPVPGGGHAIVDESGHVLDHSEARVPGLIEVAVPAGAPGTDLERTARPLLAVVEALPARAAAAVAGVRTEASGEVVLDLGAGGIVRIGRPERIAEKVSALDVLLARIPRGCIAALDLRAPSVPALTSVTGCA